MSTQRAARFGLGLLLAVVGSQAQAGYLTADAMGDTFGSGPDIISYQAVAGGGSVTFSVEFAGPISPASALSSNSLTGFIDIDKDQNSATGGNAPWGFDIPGGNSWTNSFAGSPAPSGVSLGDEFFIDLGSEMFHPGFVDVFSTADNLPLSGGPVGITYTATTFSVTLSTSLLGGGRDIYSYGLIVGDFNGPSDQGAVGAIPDVTTAADVSPVPAPGGLVLLGTAFASLTGYSGLRRVLRRK